MPVLEISEVKDVGEHRWGLSLTTDEGTTILRTTTPLAKIVAHATAKALKQKGPDATVCRRRDTVSRYPGLVG